MSQSTQPLGEKTIDTKPLRCLVVQMARLGDTLQSLMALRAAKQLYPQLEIHFLARERFAEAAKRIPWLQSVIVFPTDQILGPILKGEQDEAQGIKEIARWLGPVVDIPWEMIINWSYSDASSYLTALIPARIKLGYTRRRDSTFAAVDGWSHYIQAIVQGNIRQNIHLTDILTTQLLTALQIHFGEPAPNGEAPVTSKAFFTLSLDRRHLRKSFDDAGKKWIGVQISASPQSKTCPWTSANWIRLLEQVLQRNSDWNVVLLGETAARPQADTILKSLKAGIGEKGRLVNLVGETEFDLWASVVSRCQWLLSESSAAVHLASVLGTRVLALSTEGNETFETGPYGNGHYVVTPPPAQAGLQQSLSPDAVYAIWTYACQEWSHRRQFSLETHFSQMGWGDRASAVRAYRSTIRSTEEGGGVAYEPLMKETTDVVGWTSMVIGHIARSWYCGWVPPMGQELTRENITPSLLQKLRELQEACDVLAKICTQAEATALQLNLKSSGLKSEKVMQLPDREEIKELGKTLLDLEALIDRVTVQQPALKAFSQMVKVLMHNLKGNNLADLGKETSASYKQIQDGIRIFREWIGHTLGLVKPVSVRPASITPLDSDKELSP